jgi:hypothetical protein
LSMDTDELFSYVKNPWFLGLFSIRINQESRNWNCLVYFLCSWPFHMPCLI